METTALNDIQDILEEDPKTYFKISIRSKEDIADKIAEYDDFKIEKCLNTEHGHLLSFSTDKAPEEGWTLFIRKFPRSTWIIDEYLDMGLDQDPLLKYHQSSIYRNADGVKIFRKTFNLNDIDQLLQLYPVHFGNIMIKELSREIQRCNERITRVETKFSKEKNEDTSKESIQHWKTYLALLKHKIPSNLFQIAFITSLWEKLNDELYGYQDEDLSMRYRGIDWFAPLSDIVLPTSSDEGF